ncbi:hypothetical protein TTHERM_00629910 (macronuclear) [Tetrahymena thermophila SB210]|uniref:EGF-like domain-containing protein n=1 Tax=Tetrahymena thermophila (strain SB210) TaxID=312017 RepID=Q241U1_TETTS|nr:hypothetical protein TTHERM_00629910 [Tetrahymena thermophila SB210]EAS02479.2 hypothetical protein TTHERM_00629910 [Tetrahymena thermophila SB210]|eukprot:XP_001022724.2 hypothetical protein TTHERM_00629910 [Tetrahymena thermophila SB210]
MKILLLFIFHLQNLFCYEVLYDKKYGTDTNCLSDLPTAWTKLEGGQITQCSDTCTKQYDSSTIVKFISDENSSLGLKFSFNPTPTQPFSFIGVDIIYFQTGGTVIGLRINGSSSATTVYSTLQTTYDENYSISCPDLRSFYRGSAILSTNQLQSGNTVYINIEKDSPSQSIGIRSIRVWTNCRENCLTCSDATNCNICQPGFQLYQMPSGEFVCEQTKGCAAMNCYSCFIGDQSQICYKCAAGYNLNATGTKCNLANQTLCPAYTYIDQSGTCQQYTYSCQYQDRTTNQWTACVNQEDPRYYKCDNRMAVRVYNIENYGVFQCGCGIPNCSSCSADLTTCSQCKFGYYFNPGTSQCDSMCPSTQFYNGSFCQSCTVANCQSCSQAGTCDKCKASYVYNNLTQRCDQFIPQCSQGYYYNQTSNSCQQSCPDQNCLTCNPSGVCTTCINNYTWSTTDNRCNKNCLSNQYFDYVQNNCINCPTNCQTCDSSQCTQCNSGYLWNANDSRCNMSCSSNQYFDSVNNNCINCPANCQTCNSTQCTLCNSGYMWDSSVKTCVSCSSNQYYDSVNKNCVNCPLNCLTCNSSQCTQCNNGYLWSSNDLRCNMICSSNQYFDNANNICINCTTNCQTCNSTQCTQCNNGYTWSSGDQRCNMICQSNQYFNQSTNNCINCTQFCLLCNQNDCTLCQPGYLYDSTDKKCYIQCNTGYYLDKINNMCNACIDNCLNCSSMQNCTQCQISYTYNQIANACEKICQASQYLDVQKNQCTNCMQNCTSCTDSNSCNQCSQGYSYSSLNKICYQDCQSNQYYNETSNKCLDCGNNCLTCNQNQCTKCNQSFFTSQNDNQNCQPCSISNCKTCSSLNICAECESNYNLSLDKSKCSQGCSVDFCTQCSSQNSSACQQCQDGYELVQSQGICQPVLVVQKGQTDVNLGIKLGDDGYSIQIKFSNSVSYDNIDKSNLIYLNITNVQNYTYTIQDFEPKEIKLDIVSQENIKNQQIKIGFKNKNFVLKNQIKTIEIQQNLSPSFVVIPQSQKVATQQATQLGSGATTLLATMIPIITMSNFYVLVNTIDITGFLYYMLYINIRNPENVVQFYSIFQNFQYPFIPNLFQYVVSPNYQQTSFPKFMENQTDFYFLNSTGQAFTIHLLIMSLYLIAKIMSMIKIKYVQDYFIKAVNNTWEFNGMLDLIWNEYIYSLVGVLLQFNCYDFGDSSAFLNYTIHSLFSVIILGIPFLITFLIYKQPNVTENKRFQTKLGSIIGGLNIQQLEISSPKIKDIQDDKREPMDALSLDNIINQHKKEDIQGKSDYFQSQYQGSQDLLVLSVKPSFVQKIKSYNKYYNCILYFRKMLFGLILVFLTEYQYLQLVLLIMLNIFILFFVVLAQPLQSKYENIKNCFGEIILICIGISLSLLVQDNESEDEMFRLKIGWIIIAFTSFILLWHTIQLTYETLKSLLILMKNIVNLAFRRSQKVKPVIKETKKIDIEANNHEEKTQKNVKQETKFQELKQNQRKVSNQLEDTELILFQSNTNLPISDDLQKADSIQQIAKVSSNKNENLFIQSNNNSNDNLYINNLKSNDNVFLKPSDQKTTRTKRKSNFSNNSNKMYLNISHNQNTNRILNGFNTNREDNTFMNDNNNNNNNQQASQNHIIQHID